MLWYQPKLNSIQKGRLVSITMAAIIGLDYVVNIMVN